LSTNCWNRLTKNCTITLTWKTYWWWGCFLKWTHVLMKDWYQNIEDIKVGDIVLSYNEDTNSNEYSKVTGVFIHENNNNDLYQLTINGNTLKVTNIHPFYVKKDWNGWYQWIEAQNLEIWDKILLHNRTHETVEKIVHYPYQWNVYNIEVENMHNYYVDKWYLVHNKNNELDVYDDRIWEL
jgi:intein/homing endonuclease